MKKFKGEMRYIRCKAKNVINREKKKLIKMGCVILAVIMLAGGVMIIYKSNHPQLNNQPANVITYNKEDNKSKIFLERIEKMETELYELSNYVFSEKNLRIDETVGESSKDYITIRGNFKVKYSIDLKHRYTNYDFDNEKIVIDIPKRAIKVDSIELIGDIIEVDRYDSIFEKVKDIFNNNEEEMKDLAIKRLFDNARIESNKQNKEELYNLAKISLANELEKCGLNIEINIVNDKSISIRK